MSYKLDKPFSEKQKYDFIVEYNHTLNLRIEETENALFALEADEILNDGVPSKDPDYEKEQAEKERDRIAMLSLTAADVERAIYKAKGLDFDDIIAFVEQSNAKIDIKALKIELKANNFYRGNPYIEQVGTLLGITPAQLDEFFETNDYTKLISPVVEESAKELVTKESRDV